MKIFFAIAVLPALLINDGYLKLKKFLGKRGIKIDWFDMALAGLIIILIILFLNGFRW